MSPEACGAGCPGDYLRGPGAVVDLTLATRDVDDRAIVAVGGEIDVYTARQLRAGIVELVGAGSYCFIMALEAG